MLTSGQRRSLTDILRNPNVEINRIVYGIRTMPEGILNVRLEDDRSLNIKDDGVIVVRELVNTVIDGGDL